MAEDLIIDLLDPHVDDKATGQASGEAVETGDDPATASAAAAVVAVTGSASGALLDLLAGAKMAAGC